MKEIIKNIAYKILTTLLIFLFVFCATVFISILAETKAYAKAPTITIKCNVDGYTFTGDEWTIVEIDERVIDRFQTADTKDIPYLVEGYVKDKGIQGVTTAVDDKGVLVFEVNEATYLLYRSKAKNESFTSSPILVTMPERINGEDIYDIEITAKFASSAFVDDITGKKPDQTGDSIFTGDNTIIWTVIAVWIISAAGIVLFLTKKKKGDEN